MRATILTPPSKLRTVVDYTTPRILISGFSDIAETGKLINDISDLDVQILNPSGDAEWEYEHSFVATHIVGLMDRRPPTQLMLTLAKHATSGKALLYAPRHIEDFDVIQHFCNFENVSITHCIEDTVNLLLTRLGETRKYK